MNPISFRTTLALGVLLFIRAASWPCPAYADMSARLEAKPEAVQPAGLPVVMELTLTNSGDEVLACSTGEWGNYPWGEWFIATAAPAAGGEPRKLRCSNGQYSKGRGAYREIKPGESISFPVAIDPLPAGEYDLTVSGHSVTETSGRVPKSKTIWPATATDRPVRLAIRDDAALAAKACSDLAARVLRGEPFARGVATQWKPPGVTAKLVTALGGGDEKAAMKAAEVLWHLEPPELPPRTAAAVAEAIDRGLQQRSGPGNLYANPTLLIYLAMVAGNIGTDEALAPVLKLIHTDVHHEARWRSVQQLARFRQPRAAAELGALLKDPDDWVRSAAAIALASRHDGVAVPVLLDLIAHNKGSKPYDVEALVHFPDDARAVEAVQAATRDKDPLTRGYAERAIKQMEAGKVAPATRPKP